MGKSRQVCAVYNRAALCSSANSTSDPWGIVKVQPHSEQPSSVTSLVRSVTVIFRTLLRRGSRKKVACNLVGYANAQLEAA